MEIKYIMQIDTMILKQVRIEYMQNLTKILKGDDLKPYFTEQLPADFEKYFKDEVIIQAVIDEELYTISDYPFSLNATNGALDGKISL